MKFNIYNLYDPFKSGMPYKCAKLVKTIEVSDKLNNKHKKRIYEIEIEKPEDIIKIINETSESATDIIIRQSTDNDCPHKYDLIIDDSYRY